MAGFKRATKAQSLLRMAIFGPSGAGKTYTGLRVAKGLSGPTGRVALIDTERGSASKYSDRFEFDVLELADQSVDGYVAAVQEAAEAGYPVLVIDSLSQGWQSLLEEVEKLAKAKYRGNTWSAWGEGTPLQRKLVRSILDYPGHIVATMRSKTEWITVDDGKGRKAPQRVGLAPEQGKGIEYEFDLLIEISTDHIANVIKDRTGKFQDKLIEKPGEDFGKQLAAWLSDGSPITRVEPKAAASPAEPPLVESITAYIATARDVRTLGRIGDRIEALASEGQLTADQAKQLEQLVAARHDAIEPEAANA
jgi:AAA domain